MKLTTEQLRALPDPKRRAIEDELAAWIRADAQANALVYYRVVNPDAVKLHLSTAREFGVQGGRRSSKTATMLAEGAIRMTGELPRAFAVCCVCQAPMARRSSGGWDHTTPADDGHPGVLRYPVAKLKPPIRVRLVVTSNVNAWDENLKQKLQYSQWNGRLNEHELPGDPRCGHWASFRSDSCSTGRGTTRGRSGTASSP